MAKSISPFYQGGLEIGGETCLNVKEVTIKDWQLLIQDDTNVKWKNIQN